MVVLGGGGGDGTPKKIKLGFCLCVRIPCLLGDFVWERGRRGWRVKGVKEHILCWLPLMRSICCRGTNNLVSVGD